MPWEEFSVQHPKCSEGALPVLVLVQALTASVCCAMWGACRDYGTQHHHWVVSDKGPMSPELVQFSDELFARRLRSVMSVDDIVAGVLATLEARGLLYVPRSLVPTYLPTYFFMCPSLTQK